MFEKSLEELKALGADITTTEIKQQPELWRDAFTIYQDNKAAIEAFLADARAMDPSQRVSVIFTGAGSSDYAGDMAAPYLRTVGDTDAYDFKAIASTDIVSAPHSFLRAKDPVVLVSFARSGNSPESLAAVDVVRKYCKNAKFINITCAPEGKLAVESADDPDALTILIPRANDKGFAMTGSLSCMTLMACLIFDTASDEDKARWVETAAKMGEEALSREDELTPITKGGLKRIVYLGSGAFGGLAQEVQLKILELAAGVTATSFDTSISYRHGPKSFVDGDAVVVIFANPDPYVRQYDMDMLKEIHDDGICKQVIGVQQDTDTVFEGDNFTFKGYETLPEAYLAMPFLIVGQTIAMHNALEHGNLPDTPSPTGQVTRVVHGVTIHPFEA